MKEIYNFLTYIESLDYITFIIFFMVLVVIIDIFSAFRYYYYNILYNHISAKMDLKKLKYKRDIVISGYRTLVSEEVIKEAIEKVRSLETSLNETHFDFEPYENEYKKQIEDVRNRGYL